MGEPGVERREDLSRDGFGPRVEHRRLAELVGEDEARAIEERRAAWNKQWAKK